MKSKYFYWIHCLLFSLSTFPHIFSCTHTHTHTHAHIHTLSYICTYIYSHPQTDCFVLSELFSVARQARFPKLGSKPAWQKRQSKILPLSQEETNASEGNLNVYVSHLFFVYIYLLYSYWELNSFEEPCFTLVATIYSLHSLQG